ncbi:MAG: carbon-nitrogen hydrolase family protein [Planctomycetota bacterium]
MTDTFPLALIRATFVGDNAEGLLRDALRGAKGLGARLAVLPELPLNEWTPATRVARDEDAEDPGGGREQIQSRAAADAGLALVGGAIQRDADRTRYNTALVFDERGQLRARYRKAHLPHEAGFFEDDHYAPGDAAPERIDGFGMPFGVQICSDVNRPEGTHLLAALGAELVVAPRATEAASWPRWRMVLRANALTSCCFVASVTRPGPERGVAIGGPSFVAGPDGEVLVETEAEMCVVPLERRSLATAREQYPGYLAVRPELYADGWGNARDAGG